MSTSHAQDVSNGIAPWTDERFDPSLFQDAEFCETLFWYMAGLLTNLPMFEDVPVADMVGYIFDKGRKHDA